MYDPGLINGENHDYNTVEKGYLSHLYTFMALSKKLDETIRLRDRFSINQEDAKQDAIATVMGTNTKLHKSLLSVRNDFVNQIQRMVNNPVYSEEVKTHLKQLLSEFSRIQTNLEHKNRKAMSGGNGGKKSKAYPH